ncbi:MAG: glycine oxidase ThiO [Nitrosospira sp.]|nr:glycine oxidase ThiO [Nitrosospira sp.]
MATDVVVIGGGVIGLATAHELLRLGARVTILERSYCGKESSWAGGGILSPLLPWDYHDSVTQLVQLSNKLFPKLVEELRQETGISPEHQTCGMLVLSDVKNTQDDAVKIWCDRNIFSIKNLSPHEIVPELTWDKSALWLPAVAQVRSPRFLQALKKSVELSGGIISEHVEVKSWKFKHAHVESVITSQGEHVAQHYIVAAGAWSQEVLSEYALKMNVYPVRGQMLLFRAPLGLLKTIVFHNGFYLIPRQDGHILAGSTMENVGFNKNITNDAREELLAKTRTLLPMLTEEMLVGHWAGLRPGSYGNIPIISRHPVITNLYLNSGHHRYGVTMAPGSAHLLSKTVINNLPSLDSAPYHWPN